mgnify:FL=1
MWWGSKKVAARSAALPGETLAAIEGVAMYTRHGDENNPRIVVQPVGWSGFLYSDEAAEKWIRRAYPELTQYQIERAVNYLASLVRSHHRDSRSEAQRERWMTRF